MSEIKNYITRRSVVFGLSTLLASCSVSDFDILEQGHFGNSGFDSRYGEVVDSGYRIPAVDLSEIDRNLLRSVVRYNGPYRPGTIVVDVESRRLYLVAENGSAIRYAVGVGRRRSAEFSWLGCHRQEIGMARLDADRKHDRAHSKIRQICRWHARGGR